MCFGGFAGGADVTFIRTLVNSSVNMDVLTFTSLKQSVINVSLLSIIHFNYTSTHMRIDSELRTVSVVFVGFSLQLTACSSSSVGVLC